MNRTNRRLVRAAAPVAGLLAAGLLVWQGSTAAFTATTGNSADSWATGKLKLQNNGGGTAYADTTANLFSETGIKPGVSGVKCITVESTGSLAGTLKMYRGTTIAGTNSANLAAALTFQVDAAAVSASTNVAAGCSDWAGGTSGAAYNGTLSGFATDVRRPRPSPTRWPAAPSGSPTGSPGRCPSTGHRQHPAELVGRRRPAVGSPVGLPARPGWSRSRRHRPPGPDRCRPPEHLRPPNTPRPAESESVSLPAEWFDPVTGRPSATATRPAERAERAERGHPRRRRRRRGPGRPRLAHRERRGAAGACRRSRGPAVASSRP